MEFDGTATAPVTSSYKQGAKTNVSAQKGLGHRKDQAVSLREKKRVEQLKKKRRQGQDGIAIVNEPRLLAVDDPFGFDVTTDCESIPLRLLPSLWNLRLSRRTVSRRSYTGR